MVLKLTKKEEIILDLDKEKLRINSASYDESERYALLTLVSLVEEGKYEEAYSYFKGWPKYGETYFCPKLLQNIRVFDNWKEYISNELHLLLNYNTYPNWTIEEELKG